jgi:hypothetical protein
MSLRAHNLLLEVIKKAFGEVVETVFQNVLSPCELIFCILGIEKCELDEVA